MWKLSLRALLLHRGLFALSAMAVMLGVSLLCSTLTIKNLVVTAFSQAATSSLNADMYVVGFPVPGARLPSQAPNTTPKNAPQTAPKTAVLSSNAPAPLETRQPLDLDIEPIITGVDGVSQASPRISLNIALLGSDGKPVATPGAPTVALGIFPHPPGPTLIDGRLPKGEKEIMLEEGTANSASLRLGDKPTMVLGGKAASYTVVGIATYGEPIGSATQVFMDANFLTPLAAQKGKVPFFALQLDAFADPDVVRERLIHVLGPQAQVLSGQQLRAAQTEQVEASFAFLEKVTLGFVLLALGLGLFLISNTFRLLTRHQQRDYALLNLLGAQPSFLRRVVFLQALLVGGAGAAAGVLLAVSFGFLARYVALAVGWLPKGGALEFSVWDWKAALVSFLSGLLVALLAVLFSARRIGHISPLSALADEQTFQDSTSGKVFQVISGKRTLLGALAAVACASSGALALWKPRVDWLVFLNLPISWWLLIFATLCLGLCIVLFAPLFVVILARCFTPLLRVFSSMPLNLALKNLSRNPGRSAGGAGSLLLGVCVVSGACVVAQSAAASLQNTLASELRADLVVWAAQPVENPEPFSQLARSIPSIERVFDDLRVGPATILDRGGFTQNISLGSLSGQTASQALDFQVIDGSADSAQKGLAMLSLPMAQRGGWAVGDSITIVGSLGVYTTRVGAVVHSQVFDAQVIVNDQVMDQCTGGVDSGVSVMPVKLKPGATQDSLDKSLADLSQVSGPFHVFEVFTKPQFESYSAQSVRRTLVAVYALLALSLVIALLSVGNTLALSLLTRFDELRLLHNLGMPPSALRRSLSIECLLIGLFSSILGIACALAWSGAWCFFFRGQGLFLFSVPWLGLLFIGALATFGAVAAGALPAGRARRVSQA